jgi:hypothetical protein
MAETRDADRIRDEISHERVRLADAVSELREQVGDATNINQRVRARLPLLVSAAFATGFVISGGIGATMRYLARRSRDRS